MIISKKKFREEIEKELQKQRREFDREMVERDRSIYENQRNEDMSRRMNIGFDRIDRRLRVLEKKCGIERDEYDRRDEVAVRPMHPVY